MDEALIIEHAEKEEDLENIRQLFQEYQKEIEVDLCFQSFEEELAGLPGKYAEPKGVILLAFLKDTPVGCVALRPFRDESCEMKRLYVRPEFKGRGIGKSLALSILKEASDRGYKTMKLDTLERLEPAVNLYRTLGFIETKPYYTNPYEGVLYMEKVLG